jgi:O-antigen/teichoic acid export membrane protein
MLLMFLALVVVVCLLIRRDPKRQPNDPKRAARKQQGRMWMIAALALLAGLTLGHAPVVGPPVSGGVTSFAGFLTGTTLTGDQPPQPAPKPKPKPKR